MCSNSIQIRGTVACLTVAKSDRTYKETFNSGQ